MGRLNGAMQMVAIMQEFGWTYEQYQSQPQEVIVLILEKMRIDSKERELAAKRIQHGG